MKTEITYRGETLSLVFAKYKNGRTALLLNDSEGYPYTDISVNMIDAPGIPQDHIYTKNWSGNEEIVNELLTQGILIPTQYRPALSGFVSAPVYQIHPDYFNPKI